MSTPILQVEGLTITTPSGLNLVDNVSLVLNAGEILGLVGESGSGKTLTCRALMRLMPSPALRITAGRILFDGQDILPLAEPAMRAVRGHGIGMIFQNPATHLNPLMTIGQQIIESLQHAGKLSGRAAQQQAIDLLAQVGIPSPRERLNSYAHEFSGGMQQRAMIAIALACSPKILIADEPTTALDVTVQAQILKLLDKLRRERQLAIIMITHDLGVVAQTCDRTTVMYGGRICETADTRTLLTHPVHPYTQGLIRCQPSAHAQGRGPLTTIAGTPPTANEMPSGCRFHPRCPQARELCQQQMPPLTQSFIPSQPQPDASSQFHIQSQSQHNSACHFPAEMSLSDGSSLETPVSNEMLPNELLPNKTLPNTTLPNRSSPNRSSPSQPSPNKSGRENQ